MPKISIGMPIYNGADCLGAVLDATLAQTFTAFEIIVSDNGSSDATERIAREYAARDSRIRYIRQPENLGPALNFRFVLEQATAPYFMWAACDDIRSSDFLAENIDFLETHPDYVASTCPNAFGAGKQVVFSLTGSVEERFQKFFQNCWLSHGIFYSLMRTDVIRDCELIGQSFFGADWGIDLFLASRGNINRTERGMTVFGVNGMSSGSDAYAAFRKHPIEWLFPFYSLSRYVLKLGSGFSFGGRVALAWTLLKLNLKAATDQLHSASYRFYCARFKKSHNVNPGS